MKSFSQQALVLLLLYLLMENIWGKLGCIDQALSDAANCLECEAGTDTCNKCFVPALIHTSSNECVKKITINSYASTTVYIDVCHFRCKSGSCSYTNTADLSQGVTCSQCYSGAFLYSPNTCTWNCADFVGTYADTTTNTCKACSTSCLSCTASATGCQECSYTTQRFGDLALNTNFPTSYSSSSIVCNGQAVRSSTPLVKTYFVSPTFNSNCPGSCDGTYDNPFDDITQVFVDLYQQNIVKVSEATIKIILLKGTHYWVDSDASDTNKHNFDFTAGTSAFMLRAFERTSAVVTLSALICDSVHDSVTYSDPATCVNSDSKVTVMLKSDLIFLYATNSLTISNIIFDASQLVKYSDTTCKTSKQDCCQYDPDTMEYSSTSSDVLCSMNNGSPTSTSDRYLPSTYNDTTYQTTYKLPKPNGFINIDYLKDYSSAVIPSVSIINCEIRNLFYHKYAASFIAINRFGGKVTIQNSIFDNFMFPYGLISNGFTKQDRDTPYQTSYSGTHCKIINPSANYDYCHSITIEGSTFTNYNKQRFLLNVVSGTPEILNEGMVLHISDVFGPITVKNNVFKNMVSVLQIPNSNQVSYQCAEMYSSNKGTTSNGLGARRGSSIYKLDIDRHIDLYVSSGIHSTGAVFNIRNVTQGMVFYQNTFDSIIGMTGSALYLAGFNNTLAAPIIIKNNTFSNSFAYAFGLTMVIWSLKENYALSTCNGIALHNNLFNNNFGCAGAYGNVIISCLNINKRVASYGMSGITEDTYYKKINTAYDDLDSDRTKIYWVMFRYSWYNYTSGAVSYDVTDSTDDSTVNTYQISIINNTFTNNFAIISSGVAVIGAKDLYIFGNNFADNSIPILENYQQTDLFQNNGFYRLLGEIPQIPSELSYTFPRENSPLLTKLTWRIQVLNTNFINNYAGRGFDFYMGAAMTLDRNLAVFDVVVSNCTFANHSGFPTSMEDTSRGLYTSNLYPLVSINFATSATTFDHQRYAWDPLPSITYINFTNCTIENNSFQFVATDSYYVSDSEHPDKILWIVNYYSDSVRYKTSIAGDVEPSSAYTSLLSSLGVLISNVIFINNTDVSGLCWFHPLLAKNYFLLDSSFEKTSQTVDVNAANGNPASIFCYNLVPVMEGFATDRNLTISGLNLTGLNATLITVINRLISSETASPITFSKIQVKETYNNMSALVSVMDVDVAVTISHFTVDTALTNNGLFQFINAKGLSLSDIQVANVQSVSAAIIQASSSVFNPIKRLRVKGCSQMDYILAENRTQDPLTPSTMYALINITYSTFPIQDFVLMDMKSINLFYALESTLYLHGGLISNSSSTYDMLNSRKSQIIAQSVFFNQIHCDAENCSAGIFLSFNDTIDIHGSTLYDSSAYTSLLSYNRASTFSLQDSVIANNTVNESASALTISVGTSAISNVIFVGNKASKYAMIVGIRSTIGIENAVFLQNDAGTLSKNIYVRGGDMVLSNSLFVNYIKSSATTTDFINSLEGAVTAENISFIGGIGNAGAVSFTADIAVLNFTNCLFKDNIGYQKGGAIYQEGKLYLTNTTFVNNTAYINGSNIHGEAYSVLKASQITFRNVSNTSIHLVQMKSLELDSCTLVGESKAQAIYCESCTNVTITNSNFANFRGSACGSVLQAYFPPVMVSTSGYTTVYVTIANTTFQNNQVNIPSNNSLGGAICLASGNPAIIYQGTFTKTNFISNSVGGKGGAIYYKCSPMACSMAISSSSFTGNTAGVAGGALYFDQQPLTYSSDNIFSGNTAPYGPNTGAYPIQLSVLPSDSSNRRRNLDDLSGYDFVSGQEIDPPLRIALVDEYGQVYTLDNSSVLTVTATDSSVQYLSVRTFTAEAGVYTLTEFKVETGLNTRVSLEFSTTGITQLNRSLSASPVLTINPLFRDCKRGERISDDRRQCISCSDGTYTLSQYFNSSCKSCEEGLDCLGGDLIGPQAGYWRFDSWTQTVQECPGEGCVGYHRPENATWEGWCKEKYNETFCYTGWCNYSAGTMGNLCAECKEGYAPQALTGNCINCSNNTFNYVYTIGFIVVSVVAIGYIIRKATKDKDEEDLDEDEDDRLDTILIRIFTNYIQMISIISSFPLNWPGQLTTLFQQYNTLSTAASQMFSFDCFLQTAVFSKFTIESFFLKVLVTSIVPILITLVSILLWISIYLFRFKFEGAERRFRKIMNKIITTIIVLLFMIHSDVVYVSITALRCTNLADSDSLAYDSSSPNTHYYLEEDTSIECWTPEHKAFAFGFALPSFIFWGVGIPILAFWIVRSNRHRLRDPEILGRYGFIYDGYLPQYYYWEFVILYRKIGMVFISIFLVDYGLQLQAIAIIGICLFGYFLQTRCMPFDENRFKTLNQLELKSLMISGVVAYCGMYFISGKLNDNWNSLLFVFIMIGNIWFIVYWLKQFLASKVVVVKKEYEKLKRNVYFNKYSKPFRKMGSWLKRKYRFIIRISSSSQASFYDGITGGFTEEDNRENNDGYGITSMENVTPRKNTKIEMAEGESNPGSARPTSEVKANVVKASVENNKTENEQEQNEEKQNEEEQYEGDQ